MEFGQLADLRRFLDAIRANHVLSLQQYRDDQSNGFFHRLDETQPGDFSKSSSSTCVLSLVAAGKWKRTSPWDSRTTELARSMLQARWESAGLPVDNAFTTAFILEAVTALEQEAEIGWRVPERKRLRRGERILREALSDGAVALS